MERIYPHPFFAREGWAIMGIAFVLALLVQIFVGGFVAGIFWLLFLFVAQFFRDPAREMTDDEKAVVAPVDGRVIEVCDKLSAYIEARESIRIGVRPAALEEASMRLYDSFASRRVAGYEVKALFDSFK